MILVALRTLDADEKAVSIRAAIETQAATGPVTGTSDGEPGGSPGDLAAAPS